MKIIYLNYIVLLICKNFFYSLINTHLPENFKIVGGWVWAGFCLKEGRKPREVLRSIYHKHKHKHK